MHVRPCVGVNVEVAVCGFKRASTLPLCDQSWGCSLCTSLQPPKFPLRHAAKPSRFCLGTLAWCYWLFLDRFSVRLMVLCFCLLLICSTFFSVDVISR